MADSEASACPGEEQLAAFLCNACSPSQVSYIHNHIAACSSCQQWVAEGEADQEVEESVCRVLEHQNRLIERDSVNESNHSSTGNSSLSECPISRVLSANGYLVLEEIGRGGMGVTYKAVQLGTGQTVAVKVLGFGILPSDRSRRRFEREIELSARLQHANIARVYDNGFANGVPWYAMELIDGVHLDTYLKQRPSNPHETLRILGIVCKALQHAHQRGVIHRDLKPSNIKVSDDGQPHVLDFGLAKTYLEGDDCLTISIDGEVAGTPAFMAPEQAAGKLDEIDTRTDVYSLGAVLYFLLTNVPPHGVSGSRLELLQRIAQEEINKPRDVNGNVDSELEAILFKALAQNPEHRYSSVGEMAVDLENYLVGDPLLAKQQTVTYLLLKRFKKHRSRVITIMSLVIMAVLTAFFFVEYKYATELLGFNREEEDTLNMDLGIESISELIVLSNRFIDGGSENWLLDKVGAELIGRQARLASLVQNAIQVNEMDAIADILSDSESRLHDQLIDLPYDTDKDNLCEQVRLQLEKGLIFPMPMGRRQEWENTFRALDLLDPDNKHIHKIKEKKRRLEWDLCSQDCSRHSDGQFSEEWHNICGTTVGGNGTTETLHVSSTLPSGGSVSLDIPTVDSFLGYLHLKITVQLGLVDGGNVGKLGRIQFTGKDTIHPVLSIERSNGVWIGIVNNNMMFVLPSFVPEEENTVDLWWYGERNTFDMYVNDYLLVEEWSMKTRLGSEIKEIQFSCEQGVDMQIDDVKVSVDNAPMKVDLRDLNLTVDLRETELTPFLHIPSDSYYMTVYDFDDDGMMEIATGGGTNESGLNFYRIETSSFDYSLINGSTFDSFTVFPIGVVNDRLIVLGKRSDIEGGDPWTRLLMVDVDDDLSTTVAWSRLYDTSVVNDVVSISTVSNADEVALGLGQGGKRIEFLGQRTGSSRLLYDQCRPTIRPNQNGLNSDITSLAPLDLDEDGIDDLLFFGWGHWHAFCPAVVLLDESVSGSDVIRMTEPTGKCRVDTSKLPELGNCLIAVAEDRTGKNQDNIGSCGLRVWKIPNDVDRILEATEPELYEAGNAIALAVGSLNGENVFAVGFQEDLLGEKFLTKKLILRIYGVRNSKLDRIWESTVYGANHTVHGMEFADVNGDGENRSGR